LTSFCVPDFIFLSVLQPGLAQMIDILIILVMIAIIISLGLGLYFLVKDRGETERTVISLTTRVALAVLLVILLALGFMSR